MTHGAHATESVAILIKDAISHRATDIHLTRRGDVFEVKYCVEGLVTKQSRFANDDLRIMAEAFDGFLEGPGRTDQNLCADGVVMISQPDGNTLKVRIARLPCFPSGYDLFAKIFTFRASAKTDLNSLGYTQQHIEEILRKVGAAGEQEAHFAGPFGFLSRD